jgi:hypothetical protein
MLNSATLGCSRVPGRQAGSLPACLPEGGLSQGHRHPHPNGCGGRWRMYIYLLLQSRNRRSSGGYEARRGPAPTRPSPGADTVSSSSLFSSTTLRYAPCVFLRASRFENKVKNNKIRPGMAKGEGCARPRPVQDIGIYTELMERKNAKTFDACISPARDIGVFYSSGRATGGQRTTRLVDLSIAHSLFSLCAIPRHNPSAGPQRRRLL